MKFVCISAFEEMFKSPLQSGLVGRAFQNNLLQLEFVNPRDFSEGVHQAIDAKPFGGGDGMLMSPEIISKSIDRSRVLAPKAKCIYLSPQGRPLNQEIVEELAKEEELILLSGRYAGVDERVVSSKVDLEISLGDFVLSGGELAALCLIDAVARWVPGVLGNSDSPIKESFQNGLLEAPQFTRPREFEGKLVPEVLLSGDHKKITAWKYSLSILRTASRRPDILKSANLDSKSLIDAQALYNGLSSEDRVLLGLNENNINLL
ncbi:MAG: tRNA (guanosine(37)-N1)-methyltransferase TrmD [Bdellovibrionales bacterium]